MIWYVQTLSNINILYLEIRLLQGTLMKSIQNTFLNSISIYLLMFLIYKNVFKCCITINARDLIKRYGG